MPEVPSSAVEVYSEVQVAKTSSALKQHGRQLDGWLALLYGDW